MNNKFIIKLYKNSVNIKNIYKIGDIMKKLKKWGRYPIIITILNLWLFLPGVQSDWNLTSN